MKITHDEEECNNSFALVGSRILHQEEVEALKRILRLVLEAQKLLLKLTEDFTCTQKDIKS